MRKDFETLFSHLEPVDPPAGLFDRIVSAIQREQELQRKRRLSLAVISLLVFSFGAAPFSWIFLDGQLASSGFLYFLQVGFSDFTVLSSVWSDFSLALIESLPILAVLVFLVNALLVVFTLRLVIRLKPSLIFQSILAN